MEDTDPVFSWGFSYKEGWGGGGHTTTQWALFYTPSQNTKDLGTWKPKAAAVMGLALPPHRSAFYVKSPFVIFAFLFTHFILTLSFYRWIMDVFLLNTSVHFDWEKV